MLPHYQPRWHQQLNHSMNFRNPLNSAYIKAHLDSVNHEIAQLNLRMESILLKQHQTSAAHRADAVTVTTPSNAGDGQSTLAPSAIYRDPIDSMASPPAKDSNGTALSMPNPMVTSSPSFENKLNKLATNTSSIGSAAKSHTHRRLPALFPTSPSAIESETEHIYETIPEDSESEPIYCCPYKGDDTEQRLVEEWLTDHQKRSSNGKSPWSRTTKSNSSMEDHENSSSAYNTGGSCNSNHQLTLDLSDSNKDGNKTLVFCPTKHVQPQFGHMQSDNNPNVTNQKSTNAMTRSNSSSKKNKTLSPTHNSRKQQQEHAGKANGKPKWFHLNFT